MYGLTHDSGTVTQFTRRSRHAQEVRFSGSRRTVKVTIGDVDLPAFVSNGYVYIQAPLLVFQAFGEDLSDFVRDLELEYQQRAPHFHLVVMGVPFLARQWLSRAWYQIVGSDDPRHLRAGTQVQRCKSTRKAHQSYAAKYVAKISTCAPVQRRALLGHRWTKAPTFEVSYSGRLTVEDMRDCLALFATFGTDPSRLLAPGTALDGVLRTVELECAQSSTRQE